VKKINFRCDPADVSGGDGPPSGVYDSEGIAVAFLNKLALMKCTQVSQIQAEIDSRLVAPKGMMLMINESAATTKEKRAIISELFNSMVTSFQLNLSLSISEKFAQRKFCLCLNILECCY
jgi:hypothetical protein